MNRFTFLAFFIVALVIPSQAAGAEIRPLSRAHAHNDYEHDRPLIDALSHGFCSVEADVHLTGGELLVGHDQAEVGRTFEALYLKPLQARIMTNGGKVYPGTNASFVLLIDLKTEAGPTYNQLRRLLQNYTNILTTFIGTQKHIKPVTAIISGNRPIDIMENESVRHAALDGRLDDLASTTRPRSIALVSDNWKKFFKWNGSGQIPDAERLHLEALVKKSHHAGLPLRFWGHPDVEAVWEELWKAQVDFINTDDLPGLRTFILKKAAAP